MNGEITAEIFDEDKALRSPVWTIERGLKHRLLFAIRQYHELKDLERRYMITKDKEMVAVAERKFERTVTFLEDVGMNSLCELASQAKS